jgi:dihydrofolate reductase
MAELFVQISISLDGFIEDRNGDIGWMTSDTSVDDVMTETLRSIDGMIFGRKSHALLTGFWPTAADASDATPALIEQTRLMNTLPKYVLTHGDERTGWANSHAITVDDVPRLKREAARPIALYAGAAAVQAILGRGLVDELRLIWYPVLLGAGTALFAEDGTRRNLKLTGSDAFESGATLQRYRFA